MKPSILLASLTELTLSTDQAFAGCRGTDTINCGGIPEDVYIDFRLSDDDKIQIDLQTRDKTWVGLVLGSNEMSAFPHSDMVWFIADGENGSSCKDTRTDPVPAYGNVAPVDDVQQDVECEISVTDDG